VIALIADITVGAFLGDKACDNDSLRAELQARKAEAVIPPRRNRVRAIASDRDMCKWRHLIENFFTRIKEFRRIATRYGKTDTSCSGMIRLTDVVPALDE
jgi:transposase